MLYFPTNNKISTIRFCLHSFQTLSLSRFCTRVRLITSFSISLWPTSFILESQLYFSHFEHWISTPNRVEQGSCREILWWKQGCHPFSFSDNVSRVKHECQGSKGFLTNFKYKFLNFEIIILPISHCCLHCIKHQICLIFTPTPWLMRICFTRISLTRLFKRFPFLT